MFKLMYPQPNCPKCGSPLRLILEYNRWYCDRCKNYPDLSPTPIPKRESDHYIPTTLAGLNAVIAFFISFIWVDIDVFFARIVIIFAIILSFGTLLIILEKYKAGAILCIIGGVLTIPLGILGIFAGFQAWSYSKNNV